MTTLVRFEAARYALEQARSIDEVKDVRDKAEALRMYCKQAGESLEMQNAVAEIKIRAERRAGELLAEMPKLHGARPADTDLRDVSPLEDIGISYQQSSRWQQIASVPQPIFERHVAETKAEGEELTSASVLRLAKNGIEDSGLMRGRQKPKTNRAGDQYVPQGFDACQTPPYAIDPLLPYLDEGWTIWEPACGEGLLVEALYDSSFKTVVGTDLLTGRNFFDYEPDNWDCLVTNPPYSIKYDWLERCYSLGKPFALLLPVETLGAKTAQVFFRENGLEVIFLDQRINFKMPNIGWDGSAAQFPVAWFTWGLEIGQQMTFAQVNRNG